MPAMFRHGPEDAGVGVLGSVRLYPDRLMVEVIGRPKYAFARKMIEQFLGPMIRFQKERFEDLGKKVLAELEAKEAFHETVEEAGGPTGRHVPPRPGTEDEIPIEVRRDAVQAAMRNHYRRFLDDQVPALGGRTPRDAARDPGMRPRLLDLMKDHLNGVEQMSRRDGIPLDIGWVLDELGLQELK
jgi:hypothetical protein